MNNSIETKTPAGVLKAYLSTDPDYPGIWVDLVRTDGTEEAVALIEYKTEEKELRTLAWIEGQEDYVTKTIWNL